MACGCEKNKNQSIRSYKKLTIKDTHIDIPESNFKIEADTKTFKTDEQANVFFKKYADLRVDKITELLDEILPFLSKASEENDLLCMECCEKHLAKAQGYIEESAIKKYKLNRFYALGQLGLAETHARGVKELYELIRDERLKYQRTGEEPNWEIILDTIDEFKQEQENGQNNKKAMGPTKPDSETLPPDGGSI